MLRLLTLALTITLISGCTTNLRVAPIDDKTGLLASDSGVRAKATVVLDKATSLSRFKGVVFVSDSGEFAIRQMQATKLFERVLSYDDLQRVVAKEGLLQRVPSLNEPIGLSNLARAYQPFLWVGSKKVVREDKAYMLFVATDAETLEVLFTAEIAMPYYLREVSDQNMRYPLFNEFIAWACRNP